MLLAIEGFEGLYSISDKGEILSHRFNKVMKPVRHSGGYRKISLHTKDGVIHQKYIHRLVAEHFIPNPDNLPQVGHRGDEDKTNNFVSNLYWCTNSVNIRDAHKNGRNKRRREYGSTVHRSDDIIKKVYRFYLECGNITQAARQFEMSRTTLSSIVNKRCKVELTDLIDKERDI